MKYYRIRKSDGLLTGDIPADRVFSLLLPNKREYEFAGVER